MLHHAIEKFSHHVLQGLLSRRLYLLAVLLLAMGCTLSMLIPTTTILVIAVLLDPKRWQTITLWGSTGSAIGGSLLVLLFHHLGWNNIYEHFPDMMTSRSWQEVIAWTAAYGLLALCAIAALPLPQTPALIFCAISAQPLARVFFALLIGKLLKFGVVSATASFFPQRFSKLLGNLFANHQRT